MALLLFRRSDKEGWRIYDSAGTVWTHDELQRAVPNPSQAGSPGGPFVLQHASEAPPTPARVSLVTGLLAATALVVVVALVIIHGSGPSEPPPTAPIVRDDPQSALAAASSPPAATGVPTAPEALEQALIAQYVFTHGPAVGRNAMRVANYDAQEVTGVVSAPDEQRRYAVGVFDGNAYLPVPVPARQDFTIAFWFATKQAGGPANPPRDMPWFNGAGLVHADVPGSVADFGVTLIGGRVAFGVGDPDTTLCSSTVLNDGAWHHAVAMRDDHSGTMLLFIDGKPNGVCTGPTGVRSAPTCMCVGSRSPKWGGFVGLLDDIRCYPRQLTVSEIAELSGK